MGVLDVVSLAILAILLVGGLFLILIVAAIPGVLAKKRHDPSAEAINVAGQTVLQSFDDVEVTLTNERYLKDEEKDAIEALKDTKDALSLAMVKYDIGQTDLSPVLQLENVVSATQMANTAVEHELVANSINLYLALGGAF
jgi:outer membrane protein TolC